MPGIFGIICDNPTDSIESDFFSIYKSLRTNDSNNSGKFFDKNTGTFVGWISHKDTFSDCLPIFNEKKDIALFFSGENFCDSEDLDVLKRRHHRFNRKKADYIVHMYEEWGESFLKHLNGVFHGVLLDIAAKKIFLFNDRYGIHNLFYHKTQNSFYFSSEIKHILSLKKTSAEIDFSSLAELSALNYISDNRTVFKNIFSLPPASCWIFSKNHDPVKQNYFNHFDLEEQSLLEKAFFYERLSNSFHNILKRYYKADDPIGMFLSDSLDCRILLANAQYGQGKLPLYSTDYPMLYGHKHVDNLNSLAEKVEQDLIFLPIVDELSSNLIVFLKEAIRTSEGLLGPSCVIEYSTAHLAQPIAPIQISYDFAGPLLRNDFSYDVNELKCSLFRDWFKRLSTEAYWKNKNNINYNLSEFLNNRISWSYCGFFKVKNSRLTLRFPFLDNDFVSLMYRASDDARCNADISNKLANSSVLIDNESSRKNVGISKFIDHLFSRNTFFFKRKHIYTTDCFNSKRLDHILININSDPIKEILLDNRSLTRSYVNRKALEIAMTSFRKNNILPSEWAGILAFELLHREFIDS